MNYLLSNQYIKALGKLADPKKNIVINANIDKPSEIIEDFQKRHVLNLE
jgi:hypothetical protein